MDGAASLDAFLVSVCENDNITRQQIYPELVAYLREPSNSVSCDDFSTFLDGVLAWVSASNPKIVENGLELLALLAERLGSSMAVYLDLLFQVLIDRLAEKDRIQDRTANVFVKLANHSVNDPAEVYDRLLPAFSNKVMRVREGASFCIQKALAEMDANRLPVDRLALALATAFADPSATPALKQVSSDTLIELYRQAADNVRGSLQRSNIPDDVLSILFDKLDAVTPFGGSDQQVLTDNYDDDTASQQGEVFKRPAAGATRKPVGRTTGASGSSGAAVGAGSGAVNDEIFVRTFEETPRIELYSSRDLGTQLQTIVETISDLNKDWNRRTAAMRTLRGIVKIGPSAIDTDDFAQALRLLETAFQSTMKDLRSLVIREACITIAYMAQQMGNTFEHFAEAVMPNMIPLIPNTIAVIASSALVGVRFLVAHVHSVKLLPIITQFVTHKSKEVRAAMFGYVSQMLRDWPEKLLDRQRDKLLDLTKKGLRDAFPTARQHSREAFQSYAKIFRESALQELETMDSRERKTLGELINRESDNESLKSSASTSVSNFAKRGSFRGGKTSLGIAAHAQPAVPRASSQERPLAFPLGGDPGNGSVSGNGPTSRNSVKSTSEYSDVAPVSASLPRRADGTSLQYEHSVDRVPQAQPQYQYQYQNQYQNQNQYQYQQQQPNGASAYAYAPAAVSSHGNVYQQSSYQQVPVSLPAGYLAQQQMQQQHQQQMQMQMPVQTASVSAAHRTPSHSYRVTQPPVAPSAITTAQLLSANRSALTLSASSSRRRAAASQPGSRSGSPPREQNQTASRPAAGHGAGYQSGHAGVSQTSTLNRRTPSTSSAAGSTKVSRIPRSVTSSREPSPARSCTTLPARQHSQQNQNANSHYSPSQFYTQPDGGNLALALNQQLADYAYAHGDDDMAMPVDDRSETSSISRISETSRKYRGSSEDINEILAYMASPQWQDRRNGLAGFQCYLNSCRPLGPAELKAITDFFTRFFNDPNAKVFSALLDTLTEFIPQHRDSLYDWMYIPLTRLLLKLGSANLLGSVETRILQALDIVRNNFPVTLQFAAICRFIIDQTQTPNCKAKLATLKFLVNTIEVMTPSDFTMDSDNKLAVARLITWTVDKQSPDLRKAAALCIFKLFDLNAAEFIRLLRELSRVFQDGAYKLLIVHVRGLQSMPLQQQGEFALSQLQLNGVGREDAGPLTPGSLMSPTPSETYSTTHGSVSGAGTTYAVNSHVGRSRTSSTSSNTSVSTRQYLRNERDRVPQSPSSTGANANMRAAASSDVENMNPEAIMQDFAKTAADIARLNLSTANDELPAPNRTPQSQFRQTPPSNGNGSAVAPTRSGLSRSQLQTPTPTSASTRQFVSAQGDGQVPVQVQVQPNVLTPAARGANANANANTSLSANVNINKPIDLRVTLPTVLEILATLNEKYAERKQAFATLVQLAKYTSSNSQANADWGEQFRKVLFTVLETLKDNDIRIRYVALLTLAQLIDANGEPFCVAPEMSMLKLFDMHKETPNSSASASAAEVSSRDIARYADDCLARLALCVPKQVTLHVAINVIKSTEYPLDLAALKLVTKLLDYERTHSSGSAIRSAVADVLGELVPAVLVAYNSPQGALRKASVFCLVSIILLVGDSELRVYLEKLPAPKLKLLDVYIKRAQEEQQAGGKATVDEVIVSQTLTQDFDRCISSFWKT